MLKIEQLSKSYKNKQVLNNLNLKVNDGQFIAIVGKSGVGKSTLLFQIGLIEKVEQGKITIDGMDVTRLSSRSRTKLRKEKISFVLQDYGLVERLTIRQNINLAIDIKGKSSLSIEEIFDELEISDTFDKLPKQLSGGEKQRVAIARGLLANSKYLLMDEPTGNLDQVTSKVFQQLILRLKTKYNLTILLVTHDLDFASRADECYQLTESGQLRLTEKNILVANTFSSWEEV